MDRRICPNCGNEIDILDTECNKCGELLFDEPMTVEDVPREMMDETIEEMISGNPNG